jgi:hypothetical protein
MPASAQHRSPEARTQLDVIIDDLTTLSDCCRRHSLSILVPMGQESAYRYQEALMPICPTRCGPAATVWSAERAPLMARLFMPSRSLNGARLCSSMTPALPPGCDSPQQARAVPWRPLSTARRTG